MEQPDFLTARERSYHPVLAFAVRLSVADLCALPDDKYFVYFQSSWITDSSLALRIGVISPEPGSLELGR